ncbi:two-component sensor histidine kinase [Asanoa ishikariensis]|uniref:histidine kinase n=1 Tax=Asanoa ishikariensis TaxID=137265 RepID=A0A1H3NUM6_9ACTN|nr:histidine kinase [Asanoa ishikariensis]GIF68338.1 two-component sensor histidine kinase [Asanoa ishikariensis]SDY92651.1 Signal transduction histidine kinase [Asanoa ishikariensis]
MRLPPRGSIGRDLVLAAVALAGGTLIIASGAYKTIGLGAADEANWLLYPPMVAASGAVALRRRQPLVSLAIGTVAVTVDLALGGSLGTLLIYTQVLYDACVFGPQRLWRRALEVAIAVVVATSVIGVVVSGEVRGLALGIPAVLVLILPILTGLSVRQYRDQAALERSRAEQTARVAELDRRQAVVAERTRMARELHDMVANHLSVVAIHATAALSVPNLSAAQVQESLRVIRENSVQGLGEMRQMIDVLRGPEAEPGDDPVTPGLGEVERLVSGARSAGLAVELTTTGEPRALPVGVDLAGYRIVQESLTNALKHGTGTASVTVDYGAEEVRLTVHNPVASPGPLDHLGAGAGLIGMRERAALLRGRLDAGPATGARWRVHAALPVDAA